MNTRQIRDLVLKALGLYWLTWAVPMVFQVFPLMMRPHFTGLSDAIMVIVPMLVSLFFYGAIIFMLLFKTTYVYGILWRYEGEVGPETTKLPAMPMWIALIGLNYFISALQGVVFEAVRVKYALSSLRSEIDYMGFAHDLILLAIAIFCIVKARAIAQYLRGWTDEVPVEEIKEEQA